MYFLVSFFIISCITTIAHGSFAEKLRLPSIGAKHGSKPQMNKLVLPQPVNVEALKRDLETQNKKMRCTTKSIRRFDAQLRKEKAELETLEQHRTTLDKLALRRLITDKKKFAALNQNGIPTTLHHYIICQTSIPKEHKRLTKSIQKTEQILGIARQQLAAFPAAIEKLERQIAQAK